MFKLTSKFGAVMVLMFVLLVMLTIPYAHAATFIVSPLGLGGDPTLTLEVFGPNGGNIAQTFVTGNAATGTGSYQAAIPTVSGNNAKIIYRWGGVNLHNQPLSSFTMSYSTFLDPTSLNPNQWYVNIYVDRDNDGIRDCRLDFAPSGAVVGVWQTWTINDAATVRAFNSGGTCLPAGSQTLGAFKAANPNAVFNAFGNPADPQIRLNIGDTLANYVGYVGNLDNVNINVAGVYADTWDFEPNTVVVPPVVVPSVQGPPPPLGVPDVPGPGSSCLDHILRRVESTSFSVSIRCIRRIDNPNERPAVLEGYAYSSPTYEIEGIRDGNPVPRNDPYYGKACFVTDGLTHPVFIGYHYDQFPSDSRGWKILQRIDIAGYYCLPFLGKGYLVVLTQTETPPALSSAPISSTTEGISLNNCQVTTRAILNLRSGADLGFEVLLEVPYGANGTTLTASVRSTDGQWYKVNFNGREGWLNTGFLTKKGDC